MSQIDFAAVGQQVAAGLEKLIATYPDVEVSVWAQRDPAYPQYAGEDGICYVAVVRCGTIMHGSNTETCSKPTCAAAVDGLIAQVGPADLNTFHNRRKAELLAELAKLEKEGK